MELVYEGEQEGAGIVAHTLVGKAIRTMFPDYFPKPDDKKTESPENPYQEIIKWFGEGHTIDLLNDLSDEQYKDALSLIPSLSNLVKKLHPAAKKHEQLFLMEFALHGLAEYSKLSKSPLDTGTRFKDLLSSMFTMPDMDNLDEENLI